MRGSAPASHNRRVSGGFPHSDIPGSKGALASPGLIAECHVLHRLLLPRHPPNALIALDPIQKTAGPFARGWFIPQPGVPIWSEVVDPTALPRQRRHRGSRALNDLSIRQDPRSVSFDLERLLLLPRALRPSADAAPLGGHRTASRVLLSSRCQSPECRHPGRVSILSRSSIGQEGSSSMSPPIRSSSSSSSPFPPAPLLTADMRLRRRSAVEPVAPAARKTKSDRRNRIRLRRMWWSLSGSNR